MSSLQDRVQTAWAALEARRAEAGLPKPTQAELARAAKVKAPSVHGWLTGTTKTLKAESLVGAATYLDVDPQWLATGIGLMRPPTAPKAPPFGGATDPAVTEDTSRLGLVGDSEVGDPTQLKDFKKVPVVGEVKAGDDGYLEEFQYPVGHGEGYIEFPTADPHAYALRVRGESMHPRYRAGEFVVVAPSIEPQIGDDVVVICRNGKKLLKQLNWIRDGEVQLLSINNNYAPITFAASEIERIQLVDGRARRGAMLKT